MNDCVDSRIAKETNQMIRTLDLLVLLSKEGKSVWRLSWLQMVNDFVNHAYIVKLPKNLKRRNLENFQVAECSNKP